MSFVYVLELANDKWYVGWTSNPDKRIKAHLEGKTKTAWVKLHKPLRLFSLQKGDKTLEQELVFQLMEMYGHLSTRGGAYTNPNYVEKPRLLVERE